MLRHEGIEKRAMWRPYAACTMLLVVAVAGAAGWQGVPAQRRESPASAPQQRRYGIQFNSIEGNPIEVVGAEAGSVAERGGVQAGDRIVQMNGKPVKDLATADRVAALRGSPLVLTVERGGRTVELRLSLDGAAAPTAAAQPSSGWTAAPVAARAGAGAEPAARRMPPPAGAVVIPIDFFRHVPVVEVMINGTGPHRMFLDTGAQGSVLDTTLVEELKLPVLGEASVSSPGGQPIPAKRVALGEVKLGSFVKTNITALSLDRSRLGTQPGTPRGVLSANAFMEGSTITIAYPEKQVWIAPGELPEPDGQEIFGYGAEERLPVVTLNVAGKEMKVHLDSGAPSGFTLPLARAAELPLEAPPVEVARGRRVDREVVIYGAKLRGTVKLGGFTFENPQLRFDGSVQEGGTVGYEVLRDFVVTLDKKNRRIRLQRTAEKVASSE